jgi:hypothetical protein
LRISLAFYICYLIIFEVHSVNCSYLEDTSFSNFKTFYDKKSSNVTLLKI